MFPSVQPVHAAGGVTAGSTRSVWVPYAGASLPSWPPIGYGWDQWGGLTGGFPPQSVWWPPPFGPIQAPLPPSSSSSQGTVGSGLSILAGQPLVSSVPPASTSGQLSAPLQVTASASTVGGGPSSSGLRASPRQAPRRSDALDCYSDSDVSDVSQGVSSDESEDAAQEVEQEVEPAAPRRSSSDRGRLREAVQALWEIRPEAFAPPGDPKARRSLSAIEVILGKGQEDSILPPLLESPLITSAVSAAFRKVAGADVAGSSTASAPLQLGRFVGSHADSKSLPFDFVSSALPKQVLQLADNDRLLLPPQMAAKSDASRSLKVKLSDKATQLLEGSNRSALEMLSVADSLLSGVGLLLSNAGLNSQQSLEDVDRERVFSMLSSLGFCFSNLADNLARSYTNLVLARRDAVLESSKLDSHSCATFRSLPLSPPGLFGPQVQGLVHSLSERARDSALLRPSPPQQQQHSKRARGVGRKRRSSSTQGGPPAKSQQMASKDPSAGNSFRFRGSGRGGRGRPRGGLPPQ